MTGEPEAPAEPKRSSPALRALGVGLLGLLFGALAGGVAGLGFILAYHPHGGDIGDWTSLIVLFEAVLIGAVLGAISGAVWGGMRRPIWQLAAGLGTLGAISGVVLALVAR